MYSKQKNHTEKSAASGRFLFGISLGEIYKVVRFVY